MQLAILWTIISLLLIIEGAFIIFSPHKTAILMKKITKNHSALRIVGIIEFLLGIVLLISSFIY